MTCTKLFKLKNCTFEKCIPSVDIKPDTRFSLVAATFCTKRDNKITTTHKSEPQGSQNGQLSLPEEKDNPPSVALFLFILVIFKKDKTALNGSQVLFNLLFNAR